MSDPRYYTQELETLNVADLLVNAAVSADPAVSHRVAGGELPLIGIVDEEYGGIVAYAIGDENAERIAAALEGVQA